MDTNIEETIPLNTTSSNYQNDDQIEKYFNLNNKIRTISLSGYTGLHVVSRFQYNEVVQSLIPNNAIESFENISSQLTLNNQLNSEQIQDFILNNANLDHSEVESQNNDYIESSLNRDNLIKQAK